MLNRSLFTAVTFTLLANCSANPALDTETEVDSETPTNLADIVSVEVTGGPGSYQFAVGIASPDEGCNRYANWWEVVGEDQTLHYRRILTHSHVNEQPFVRSGSPVEIVEDETVWVRAHMHPDGYGGVAFKGSVAEGFRQAPLGADFAAELAEVPPLPNGCGG